MEIILGLDISTTTIGIAVLARTGKRIKLKNMQYYKPPKNGDLFERLMETKSFILKIVNEFNPDHVVIEDITQYMANKSGAKTIIALAVFNRMIGLAVYEKTNKLPVLMNVNTIRKLIKTGKNRLSKEDIPEAVSKHLKFDFPYKLNKKGKVSVENYDMADAVAVALAFCRDE